ncbi:MAG: flavin reductase family protein [Lentisphaeraceae bacterium]|nr:flavin reductase family protein [Lentisphaeraceae bacterium]
MIINLKDLKPSAIYKTMIQTVIPRPIAWTLTENENGSFNLAPFSYFNAIGSNPPMVSLSIGKRADGNDKDTKRNIEQRQYFTVHIPSVDNAQLVTDSAKAFDPNISEIDELSLELVNDGTKTPRLKDCKVAYFCKLEKIIKLGNVPQNLIIGLVESIYVADDCIQENDGIFTIDASAVNPLGRLGGSDYCTFGKPFTITPSP